MSGLDSIIEKERNYLQSKLWADFNVKFYGRSFVNNNKPFAYDGDYKELLSDDLKDATIHFHVQPKEKELYKGIYKADVFVMVSVNIGKMYGNDERAINSVHRDVLKYLKNTQFKIGDIVSGIEAFDIYSLSEKQKHQFNLHPYYVFRIETTCNYTLNSCNI